MYQFAVEKGLMIAPVSTVRDIADDEQLAARNYFQTVEHQGLGRPLTLVGPFAKLSASPMAQAAPAPSLGEHNVEVLVGELGLESDDLQILYSQRAI
jgi:crotonobetainyl-CoA:carnitine CoA-transferase CaiB-like acyl-CoA transferase